MTEDFGKTWNVVQQYVASFFWHSITSSSEDMELYVQRSEPTDLSSVLSSKNLFKSGTQQTIIAEEVKDFQIKGDFVFITKKFDKVSTYINMYVLVTLYGKKIIINFNMCFHG